MTKKFNFGKNWKKFSVNKLDKIKFKQALKSLEELIGRDKIENKTFLDIGTGSGIFSIGASILGAKKIKGIDISKESIQAAKSNQKKFGINQKIIFEKNSILDKNYFENEKKFDIVYSWGVLHHTGNMYQAIQNTVTLVKNNGTLVIAIYNKHSTSRTWLFIKKLYNQSSKLTQKIMIGIFYPTIFFAKFAVTGKNPFKKNRGMNFYYDVIDWIGGYPYEYASKKEIKNYVEKLNFQLIKYRKSDSPIGCNEYVFKKKK